MNLIRYYNQNRKKIGRILIIICSAFILLQVVNYIYRHNLEKMATEKSHRQETLEINTNTTKLTNNKSTVTGEDISNNQLKNATTTIDNFLSYCNNKELQKAYDLLTDECKMQMYNNLEVFEQAYYNEVFHGEVKNCTVENWINNTYKIKITGDILSIGKVNKDGYVKQDYVTVQKVNDDYKLNINSYIGYTQINKTTNKDNIQMKVLNKNTYMEYEEYTISVTNHTDNLILLDGRSNVKTLFLQDSKEVKYSSYSHELTEPMLTIESGQTKEVTIKFYSSYVSTKNIQYIVFSDLILYNGQMSEKIQFRANV